MAGVAIALLEVGWRFSRVIGSRRSFGEVVDDDPADEEATGYSQPFALEDRQSTNVVTPISAERQRVAELPAQLGHVPEVHAVDAGDERGDDEDGAPRRHLLHHLVQLVRRDREVGLEQAGEQVALRLDEVADAEHAVVDVVEVHDRLLVDEVDLRGG